MEKLRFCFIYRNTKYNILNLELSRADLVGYCMARVGVNFVRNLNLAVALVAQVLGINKSQLIRMAVLEYLVTNINRIKEEKTKYYLMGLLDLAVQETNNNELSPAFKKEILVYLSKQIEKEK